MSTVEITTRYVLDVQDARREKSSFLRRNSSRPQADIARHKTSIFRRFIPTYSTHVPYNIRLALVQWTRAIVFTLARNRIRGKRLITFEP